jgi:DNA repair protein RadC
MKNVIYHQKLKAIKSLNDSFLIESITNSTDCFNAALTIWENDLLDVQECFYALYLNLSLKPTCFAQISKGAINGCVIDIRLLLSHAILSNSKGMIIFHNHPSGNINPSKADLELTKQIADACKIMQINLHDHLILTPNQTFYSFADNGLI